MSNNLPVLSNGNLPGRYERRLGKAVSAEIARLRAEEALAIAAIDAIEVTSQAALSSVASLSLSEVAYTRHNPYAAPRLQLIADAAALATKRRIDRLERGL